MHVMVLGQLKGIFAKTGATIRKLFSQRCWCDWYQKCVNVIEDLVGLNANVYICFHWCITEEVFSSIQL